MLRRAVLVLILACSGFLLLGPNAEACHRRSYSSCCYPCCDPCPVHWCGCLAYKNPYTMAGGYYYVVCYGCPCHYPSWHWCYSYSLKRWDWFKIAKCYYGGAGFDKDAQEAEGYPGSTQGSAAGSAPASVVVYLPAGAELTIDDQPTTSKGDVRIFATPSLAAGENFGYDLKAAYIVDGQLRTVNKRVTVRAGEETAVDFRPSSVTIASR